MTLVAPVEPTALKHFVLAKVVAVIGANLSANADSVDASFVMNLLFCICSSWLYRKLGRTRPNCSRRTKRNRSRQPKKAPCIGTVVAKGIAVLAAVFCASADRIDVGFVMNFLFCMWSGRVYRKLQRKQRQTMPTTTPSECKAQAATRLGTVLAQALAVICASMCAWADSIDAFFLLNLCVCMCCSRLRQKLRQKQRAACTRTKPCLRTGWWSSLPGRYTVLTWGLALVSAMLSATAQQVNVLFVVNLFTCIFACQAHRALQRQNRKGGWIRRCRRAGKDRKKARRQQTARKRGLTRWIPGLLLVPFNPVTCSPHRHGKESGRSAHSTKTLRRSTASCSLELAFAFLGLVCPGIACYAFALCSRSLCNHQPPQGSIGT